MKAGKPTELPSSPLDNLSPGPAFDKAAAWYSLQQRLEKKKTRIILPWKWAAAAAALLICTILLWPSAKKDSSIVKTIPGKKIPAPVIQTADNALPLTGKQPETSMPGKTGSPVNPAVFRSVENSETAIQPVMNEVYVRDSITRITTEAHPGLILNPEPATVKKKLRVVYNNELVVTDPEEMAASAEETENPVPLFRKIKLNHTRKAENTLPEEITPERKKGILFFNSSIKPKD